MTIINGFVQRRSGTNLRRFVTLWLTVGYALGALMFSVGLSYAIGGRSSTPAPQLFEYVALFPGGLHTHGVIMSTCGVLLLSSILSLSRRDSAMGHRWVSIAGMLVLSYSTWCSYGFIVEMITAHQYNTAPIVYTVVLVLSGALVSLQPSSIAIVHGESTGDGRV